MDFGQRWASDPAFADSHEANPVDRYEVLLRRLVEIGRVDIARASVSRLADLAGCELVRIDEESLQSDKGSLDEACLDVHPALMEFHQAVRSGATVDRVRHALEMAIQELRETMAKYLSAEMKQVM